MVTLRPQASKNYKEAANRRRKTATDHASNSSVVRKRKVRRDCRATVLVSDPKTFSALPEELRLEIYKWNANRLAVNHIPGFQYACWLSSAYDSGIAGVSRQIQQAADSTLDSLDRENEARICLHWKGIKQLPRLLQLLAHTYSWGERWLEANPPNMTDDRQDWVRIKQSTSHNLDILLQEYLNPTFYKKTVDDLGSSSRSPKLCTHLRDWFTDTAAPISLAQTEQRVLIEFLEMTMDKMRNLRTTGDLEICLIFPRALFLYLDSVDQTKAMDPYHISQCMYQFFNAVRKDFRINFHLVAVLESPACQRTWTWTIKDYVTCLDPGFGLVEKEDADDFQVFFGSIRREHFEKMDIA